MEGIPAFHPEWLVTFWLSTPALNWMNPHYILMLLAGVVIWRFIFRKRNVEKAVPPDSEDQRFQHLLLKKNVIEKKLKELEIDNEESGLLLEDLDKKRADYLRHLDQVKKELQQYTY